MKFDAKLNDLGSRMEAAIPHMLHCFTSADSRERLQEHSAPMSFIFMQFSGENRPNNRLAPPPLALASPSEKFRTCHCFIICHVVELGNFNSFF